MSASATTWRCAGTRGTRRREGARHLRARPRGDGRRGAAPARTHLGPSCRRARECRRPLVMYGAPRVRVAAAWAARHHQSRGAYMRRRRPFASSPSGRVCRHARPEAGDAQAVAGALARRAGVDAWWPRRARRRWERRRTAARRERAAGARRRIASPLSRALPRQCPHAEAQPMQRRRPLGLPLEAGALLPLGGGAANAAHAPPASGAAARAVDGRLRARAEPPPAGRGSALPRPPTAATARVARAAL